MFLLKLRTILLSKYLYILLLVITLLITIIRINLPKNSLYNEQATSFTGTLIKYVIAEDKLTLTLKNKEKIQATYYFKTLKEKEYFQTNFNLGDKVNIKGEFTHPKENTTKYLFNYQKYLYNKNIFYLVSVKSYQKISSSKNIIYYLKNKINKRLSINPYLYTFIIGDKNYLSSDIISSYQEIGISHLFAISGMHISLLSSIILKILQKLKLSENKRYTMTSLCLLLYLLLTDISPSILRGVIFFILFSLNKIYYFYIKPLNIYLLTFIIVILINPFYIFDIGFQYSFLISFYLLYLSNLLNSNKKIISLLKVSLISFIVSIPLSIYNFFQINVLSIIYNLFYVPYISIIIFPLSLLTFIFPFINPLYKLSLNLLEQTALFLSKFSLGKFYFYRFPFYIYIIYLLLIFSSFYLLKKKRNYYSFIILFIILSFHLFYPHLNKGISIDIIDVGQGDSLLIYSNKEAILIDTGGKKEFSSKLGNNKKKNASLSTTTIIPHLKSLGIKKLDYLILTHGDYDHLGEATKLVLKFPIKNVIFNRGEYNDLELTLKKVLQKKKIPYYKNIEEINFSFATLLFLNTNIYANENDNSNVIYFNYQKYQFLFMGDAGSAKEQDILEKYTLKNIDFFKVGHHGSTTSSSYNFINIINPKYSFISVGEDNKYGHPAPKVLKTLATSKIYRTDLNGTIEIKIKNNRYKIISYFP